MTATNEGGEDLALRPPAHSIRNRKFGTGNYKKKPVFLTLMAIGFDKEAQIFWTRTYRTKVNPKIDEAGIQIEETRLADFAISHSNPLDQRPTGVEQVSRNVDNIDFIDCSYFTVVICWKDWAFVDDAANGLDPLRFWKEKTGTTIRYANSSFFDADAKTVKTAEGDFNAVRCINHLKEDDGSDVPTNIDRPFGFDIYLTVPLSPFLPFDERAIVPSRVVIIIDPTGDNKGP